LSFEREEEREEVDREIAIDRAMIRLEEIRIGKKSKELIANYMIFIFFY
jgi:hypothetical protein